MRRRSGRVEEECVLSIEGVRAGNSPAVVFVLLWTAGFSLRVTVLALPPVMNDLSRALGMTSAGVGMLTAIPSLLFAVAAVPGAMLIGRFGMLPCLLAGLCVATLGSVARIGTTDAAMMYAATAIMSAGIAVTQTALPSLARAWLPDRVGLGTATYTFGLLAGEIAPAALPIASLPPANAGWPSQLLFWSFPVALTAAAISIARPRGAEAAPAHQAAIWPDWSSPVLWRAGILLGAVNTIYFGLNGFVPGWLAGAGEPEAVRRTLLALNVSQLPAAVVMMRFSDRLVGSAGVYVAAAAGVGASGLVLGVAPGAMPVAAAVIAGFLLALLLSLALTVPPLVAGARQVSALTAGIFTVGYTMAVLATLAIGWLGRSGPRGIAVAPLAAAAVAIVVVGPPIARRMNATRDHCRKRGC